MSHKKVTAEACHISEYKEQSDLCSRASLVSFSFDSHDKTTHEVLLPDPLDRATLGQPNQLPAEHRRVGAA